jgi:hypothetical protein
MDDYPAADPIPDPSLFDSSLVDSQHSELIDFLTNSRDMRQSAKSSFKQAAYAGGAAMAGGFLLGPVGGLVGGIVGSIIGFVKSDNYDGAILGICKLDVVQKKILMRRVGQVLMAAGASTQALDSMSAPGAFRNVLASFASQRTVRDDLWNACVQSLQE